MNKKSRLQKAAFQIINQNSVSQEWNGSPTTLLPNQNANMLQTTNGSMVFAYFNQSTQNNQGTLSLTSGGGAPQFLDAPALANQPSILVNNWKANNLSVTNISPPASNTPIWISAFGPGLPGWFCVPLTTDGNPTQLAPAQCAQGTALPRWMQLLLQSNTGDLTIFAVIGGPVDSSGNNAYVFAVNAAQNTGPGTGLPPPPGYYATITGNYYTFQFNWGSSTIYVVNMSPATAAGAGVQLSRL